MFSEDWKAIIWAIVILYILVALGIEYPIFVESDAVFESGFENIIKSVLHKEPSFDLLYLGRKSFKDDYIFGFNCFHDGI